MIFVEDHPSRNPATTVVTIKDNLGSDVLVPQLRQALEEAISRPIVICHLLNDVEIPNNHPSKSLIFFLSQLAQKQIGTGEVRLVIDPKLSLVQQKIETMGLEGLLLRKNYANLEEALPPKKANR